MSYVFDTSPFVGMFTHYYPSAFPTLWQRFDALIADEGIVSTREVYREIEDQDDDLFAWAKANGGLFSVPTADEGAFIAQIYGVAHFQANIEQQKLLKGGKNADPFVIAKAAVTGRQVVTLERHKPNAAKIPNICQHFDVPCLNLEQFMQQEDWQF